MKKLENFREKVDMIGSVMMANGPLKLEDWDDIFRRMSAMGISNTEMMFYYSPEMLEDVKEMLDIIRATAGNGNYGEFHPNDNAWSFIVDLSFTRGSYTVHVMSKAITGALLAPQLPEDQWGAENLAKSSINILPCQ